MFSAPGRGRPSRWTEAPEINAINTVWTLVAAFSCSACRSASSCSRPALPASASPSTSWSKASSTPASAASPSGPGASPSCSRRARLHRHHGFFLQGLPDTYGRPASRCWPSGSSSSPSPTPARRLPRARWSGAAASSATSFTASASPVHLPDHRPLGLGAGRLAGRHAAPFRDFAGSTVVHTIGGAISLVGAIALGPRLGRVFRARRRRPDASARHHPRRGRRSDPVVRLVRVQPGQHPLRAGLQGIGRVSFNTTLAACSAGLAAMFFAYSARRQMGSGNDDQRLPCRPRRDYLPMLLGQPDGAFFIGSSAACRDLGNRDSGYMRIDDPIGAVPVHRLRDLGHVSLGCSRRASRRLDVDRCGTRVRSSPASSMVAAPVSWWTQFIGSGAGRVAPGQPVSR